MKNLPVLLIAAVLMLGAGNVYAEDGHCAYTMENMFAGPFKVCLQPSDAAACAETGTEDDNADAVHGEGACSAEGSVGTCDMGEQQMVYYEGEPDGLEIGCGFQGGDWILAE